MKKIMHIAQAAGGVERYLNMLLRYMDHKEFTHILVVSQDYNIEKLRILAERVEQVEMHREIDFFQECKAVRDVRRLIKKYQPDILYMHSTKAGVTGRLANIGFKSICVYNPHGWSFNMKCGCLKKSVYALIERMLAPLCSKIIAISNFEKQSALDNHICKENKIVEISNGIDVMEYVQQISSYTREKLHIPQNAMIIGTVGRLDQQKAPDVFVNAAMLIKQKIPTAFFIMVGDGGQRVEIEEMIKKAGLQECFLITGWVSSPREYVELFDVALLLSRWEGFGLVLPEYMAAEKAIVATAVDAIPDIIQDGKNGLLVEPNDPQAVCEAVLRLQESAELRNRLVQHAKREVYQRFDVKRVAKEHEKLFYDLLYAK